MDTARADYSDALEIVKSRQPKKPRSETSLRRSTEARLAGIWQYYSQLIDEATSAALERLKKKRYPDGIIHNIRPLGVIEEERVLWIVPGEISTVFGRCYFLIDHTGCLYDSTETGDSTQERIVNETSTPFDFGVWTRYYLSRYAPTKSNYRAAVQDISQMLNCIVREINRL